MLLRKSNLFSTGKGYQHNWTSTLILQPYLKNVWGSEEAVGAAALLRLIPGSHLLHSPPLACSVPHPRHSSCAHASRVPYLLSSTTSRLLFQLREQGARRSRRRRAAVVGLGRKEEGLAAVYARDGGTGEPGHREPGVACTRCSSTSTYSLRKRAA
jgi:hypothetical protein